MTTPRDEDLLRMDGWPGGMTNRAKETESVVMREGEAMPSSQFLRRALNVDLTAEGHPQRRQGYRQVLPGYSHSAWWCAQLATLFVVVEGQLYAGRDVETLAPLRSVNRYLRVSYTFHGESVYWMNGAESGRVSASGSAEVWPDPVYVPESGTRAEGDELIVDEAYEAMPVGQLVESFAGRLWVAMDAGVYFSEPLGPNHYRPATNFFQRPGTITLLEESTSGLYVGDDRGVWFLRGTNPFEMSEVHVSPYGVVPQAFARIPGEKLGLSVENVPVWWGLDGVLVAGLPDGQVRQLTRDRLATPEYGSGAVSIREVDGISQIVAALQKGGDENTMAATDSIVAEVRRNNVTA